MYAGLLGIAVVILFFRTARADEENPFVWSLLAVLFWYVPMLLLSLTWAILGVVFLFGVYFALRLRMKSPPGGGVVR
jgi:hypothetical protein